MYPPTETPVTQPCRAHTHATLFRARRRQNTSPEHAPTCTGAVHSEHQHPLPLASWRPGFVAPNSSERSKVQETLAGPAVAFCRMSFLSLKLMIPNSSPLKEGDQLRPLVKVERGLIS